MGGQSFIYDETSIKDIYDYCRISQEEVIPMIDYMISEGILENNEFGLTTTMGMEE